MWIITYRIAHRQDITILHNEVSELSEHVKSLKVDRHIDKVRVFRVGEEVDINAAYPDYFGGDDSGQCP